MNAHTHHHPEPGTPVEVEVSQTGATYGLRVKFGDRRSSLVLFLSLTEAEELISVLALALPGLRSNVDAQRRAVLR